MTSFSILPHNFLHSNAKILFCHFSQVKLGEISDFCMTHSLACCKTLFAHNDHVFFSKNYFHSVCECFEWLFRAKIIFYYSELSLHAQCDTHATLLFEYHHYIPMRVFKLTPCACDFSLNSIRA